MLKDWQLFAWTNLSIDPIWINWCKLWLHFFYFFFSCATGWSRGSRCPTTRSRLRCGWGIRRRWSSWRWKPWNEGCLQQRWNGTDYVHYTSAECGTHRGRGPLWGWSGHLHWSSLDLIRHYGRDWERQLLSVYWEVILGQKLCCRDGSTANLRVHCPAPSWAECWLCLRCSNNIWFCPGLSLDFEVGCHSVPARENRTNRSSTAAAIPCKSAPLSRCIPVGRKSTTSAKVRSHPAKTFLHCIFSVVRTALHLDLTPSCRLWARNCFSSKNSVLALRSGYGPCWC